MSEVLGITLGNSTAAMTVVRQSAAGSELVHIRRVPVRRLEDFQAGLAEVRERYGGGFLPVVVSSVNPGALARFQQMLKEARFPPAKAARQDFPIPIATEVDDRKQVGVDRLLAALAAPRLTGGACVVADFGTAITVNAVRSDGTFLGGAIFAGLHMMSHALQEGTALLPEVPPEEHPPAVGANTRGAIQAGLLHGTAGAIACLIAGARRVVGASAHVLLTGGHAPWIAPLLPPDCRQIEQNLVLHGLVIAYREWQER